MPGVRGSEATGSSGSMQSLCVWGAELSSGSGSVGRGVAHAWSKSVATKSTTLVAWIGAKRGGAEQRAYKGLKRGEEESLPWSHHALGMRNEYASPAHAWCQNNHCKNKHF